MTGSSPSGEAAEPANQRTAVSTHHARRRVIPSSRQMRTSSSSAALRHFVLSSLASRMS